MNFLKLSKTLLIILTFNCLQASNDQRNGITLLNSDSLSRSTAAQRHRRATREFEAFFESCLSIEEEQRLLIAFERGELTPEDQEKWQKNQRDHKLLDTMDDCLDRACNQIAQESKTDDQVKTDSATVRVRIYRSDETPEY